MVAPHPFGVRVLESGAVGQMVAALIADGRTVVGPTLRDGVVALDELGSADDLCLGRQTKLEPGRYRLAEADDDSLFGALVGPTSMKRWRRPPESVVWRGVRRSGGFESSRLDHPDRSLAFVGIRACDLAAVRLYDQAVSVEPGDDFIVAVECTNPGSTCFCVSMGTGPGIDRGADLVITEITAPAHGLVTRAYTSRGVEMLDRLGGRTPTSAEEDAAWASVAAAARTMVDGIDPDRAAAALRYPSAQGWNDVGARCMACGNCTLVCPTCFCTTTVDQTTPDGSKAMRVRQWDSCFSAGFSEVHGGPVRASVEARYRQWISHKLSWWWDQFGSSGCVGCGRCIVWCPVGIDIRAEAAAAIERVGAHV